MKVWEIVKDENEGKLYMDVLLGDIYKLERYGLNLELIDEETGELITNKYVTGVLVEIEFEEVKGEK